MRLPLAIPLDARSGSSSVDARLTNAVVESYEGRLTVAKRPGLSQIGTSTGNANGTVCFGGNLFSLFGTAAFRVVSSGGNSWTETTTGNAGSGLGVVGFFNNLFVALPFNAGDSNFATSTDGLTWTARTSATLTAGAGWGRLAYGAGLYVATNQGTSSSCASSPDGITWTSRTMPSSSDWGAGGLCFGGGKFVSVAFAFGTKAAYSSDGITWTAATLPSSTNWYGVAHGAGVFVAVGVGSSCASSTDGITWTTRTMPSSETWIDVVYAGGQFVAIANSSTAAATSPDGITWTARTLPANAKWYGLTYGTSNYVALESGLGAGTNVATSSDGITWASGSFSNYRVWSRPTYGADLFVTMSRTSDYYATSANGTTSLVSAGTIADTPHDFAQSGSTSVLFLKSKNDAYTWDGTTLTTVSDVDYPATTCRGTAYLDGRVFASTTKGVIYQSADENFSSWAALDFVSAHTEPDEAVFLCKYRDYIMLLKQWSCEFFYDAANATGSILSPVRNMFQLIGCASENSVRETAGTVVWLGKTKDGFGRSIYMMAGSEPQKISTVQVDKVLDADDLSSVSSWTAKLGSHTFYGINLSAVSLAYDLSSGVWSVFTYLASSGVTKTISAIDAAGVVTSTAHGYADGDIVLISGTNADYNGWHVVTQVSANAFSIQGTGATFSGSGSSVKHTEGVFPVKHSTSCGGKQIMQANGVLYEFLPDQAIDQIGAIAMRVRTVKFDGGEIGRKTFGEVELIGDKVAGFALLRFTDDDFSTFSKFKPVNLLANRSRVRRLGDANRRAFEILAVDAAATRLEALEM